MIDKEKVLESIKDFEKHTHCELVITTQESVSLFFEYKFLYSTLLLVIFYFLPYSYSVLGALPFIALIFFIPNRFIIPKKEIDEIFKFQAKASFVDQGVTNTLNRSGALLFLSLKEKRIFFISDTGIKKKAADETFDEACLKVLSNEMKSSPLDKVILKLKDFFLERDVFFSEKDLSPLGNEVREN